MDLSFDTFKPLIGALASAGLPVLEKGITVAATAVAGPLGMLVSPALNVMFPLINNVLGLAPTATPAETAAAVATATPAQMDGLKALQEQDAFKLSTSRDEQAFQLALNAQQLSVITAEVSNPSLFVGGWRPAICWGLGGLLLLFKGLPLPVYALQSFGLHLTAPPDMDFLTFSLISSLLGVAIGARSLDKHLGNDAKAIGGKSTIVLKKPSLR